MRSIYFAFLRQKDHVIFIFALFLSLLILFSGDNTEIAELRIRFSRYFAFTKIPSVWMTSKRSLDIENSDLRNKNLQLKLLLESMRNLENDNLQMRSLLDFNRESHLNLLPAAVHGKGITTTLSSFIIDVGTNDGVVVNDPVVIADGVVGKTMHVGETTSIIQLISDPDFRFSVRIVPDGAIGILSWLGNNVCEIREVPKSAKINVGDLVYTSSYSDIFPASLPVGRVSAIFDERGSFQKRLKIKLHYNIGILQYVFVILE